jgi:glycosyltransferase involved in cell wall biosynthesis
MRNPVSLYLIAGNEEAYIERCIRSFAPLAAEAVVCIARGSQAPDKTEEIAKSLGAKVVYYHNQKTDWPHIDDFAAARNTALNACSCDWSFWVDADDEMAKDAPHIVDDAIDQANQRSADLIAFRYWVENAQLNPLREMALRKGKGKWRNRVHEMLCADEPNKLIGIDKIVRIHRPHGYKATSAERNFRILEDVIEPAPNALYYKAQEQFLSGKHSECYETSKKALMFESLEDTLRYDVLTNLGRIAPDKERLRWLGEAITLMPDRREAYFWAGQEYAAKGKWVKCYGAMRSCMTLPRPKTHYWNLNEAIYQWQSMDLYETASVSVGEIGEAEKMKKVRPAPKISIIHATRGRPQIAWQRRWQWLCLAEKPLEVEWIFVVDHDDPQDYTPHQAIRCNPGGIINAWNYGAKQAKGDILVQMSDDWSPPRHWDSLISTAMGATNEEKALAISDGLRTDKLLCMAILTQKRLQKQGGYMFHPDYQESDGIYSDNEFTERAYADGVVVEAKHIQFKHENPLFTGGKPDDLIKHHNKPEFYEKGKAIYEKRKAANWD